VTGLLAERFVTHGTLLSFTLSMIRRLMPMTVHRELFQVRRFVPNVQLNEHRTTEKATATGTPSFSTSVTGSRNKSVQSNPRFHISMFQTGASEAVSPQKFRCVSNFLRSRCILAYLPILRV